MKYRGVFVGFIKLYQYISRMLPANCRYYPTCSEYARWKFELDRPDKAMFSSLLRILRCNQFFAGGIDYPVMRYTPPAPLSIHNAIYIGGNRLSPPGLSVKTGIKMDIKYWIVHKKGDMYYIVKDFNG